MTNTEVIDAVRVKLEGDRLIAHPKEIAVPEREGDVTLRGTVGSIRQRQAAVRATKSVPGVRVVVDQLKVDLRDHVDDEETRGLALQALLSTDNLPAERVDVAVSSGWLTLKGEVRYQYESDLAFAAVSDVPGVGGITNKIEVITAGIDG